MNYCPGCGEALEVQGNFCPNCGAELSQRPKRLLRDPSRSLLGGVCQALADYFKLDVSLVRVITVTLSVLWFPIVPLLYLCFWFLVPRSHHMVSQ